MRTSMAFYTDPAVIQLVLDTTPDKEKQMDYAYRFSYASDTYTLAHMLAQFPGIVDAGEAFSTKQWFKDVITVLTRLGNRVFKIGRTLVENISKEYEFIARMWESKLQKHMDKIVDERFRSLIVSVCSLEVLKKRIEIVGHIHQLLNNAESIVNSPIQDVDDPNSYNTPEFVECYKELKDIGFAITNKTFTESRSQGYTSQEEKRTLEKHGYSKSDLPELVRLAQGVASVATKKWLNTMVTKFQQLNAELEKHEKAILTNQLLEETEKKLELKKDSIRISRLWWLSNYVHLLQLLSEDCMKYILKIFRAADESIPLATNERAEETAGNKYFF